MMFIQTFEGWMAWRMFKGRSSWKISGFSLVSLLGVAVAVAALIVTFGVMNGFDREFREKILGMKAHVIVSSASGQTLAEDPASERMMRSYPGVIGVSPYLTGQAMIVSRWGTQGIGVFGVDPARHRGVTALDQYVTSGSLEELKGTQLVLALGEELAGVLGVKPGDTVTMFIPVVAPTPFGLFSKVVKCRVGAMFKSGMYEYDRTFAFLPLEAAQELFGMKGRVTQYAIRLEDLQQAHQMAARLRADRPEWSAADWMELNRNLFGALKMERYVMGLILVLILLVASFTIVGTLTMLVMEKKRQIGMLRAMGASSYSIQRMFLRQGGLIGGMGSAIGMVLGLAGCAILQRTTLFTLPGDIYYLTRIPMDIRWIDVAGIGVTALTVSTAAAWWPARRAATLDPVEAIRYE